MRVSLGGCLVGRCIVVVLELWLMLTPLVAVSRLLVFNMAAVLLLCSPGDDLVFCDISGVGITCSVSEMVVCVTCVAPSGACSAVTSLDNKLSLADKGFKNLAVVLKRWWDAVSETLLCFTVCVIASGDISSEFISDKTSDDIAVRFCVGVVL